MKTFLLSLLILATNNAFAAEKVLSKTDSEKLLNAIYSGTTTNSTGESTGFPIPKCMTGCGASVTDLQCLRPAGMRPTHAKAKPPTCSFKTKSGKNRYIISSKTTGSQNPRDNVIAILDSINAKRVARPGAAGRVAKSATCNKVKAGAGVEVQCTLITE